METIYFTYPREEGDRDVNKEFSRGVNFKVLPLPLEMFYPLPPDHVNPIHNVNQIMAFSWVSFQFSTHFWPWD